MAMTHAEASLHRAEGRPFKGEPIVTNSRALENNQFFGGMPFVPFFSSLSQPTKKGCPLFSMETRCHLR